MRAMQDHIYTPTFCEIYNKAGHAVMWALYDPLHTNAQNRSRVHSLDESHWERRREMRESRAGSTSTPNPFKCWRDGALQCSRLEDVSYTEEAKSKDTQCSTQKNTNVCKQTQVTLCMCTYVCFQSLPILMKYVGPFKKSRVVSTLFTQIFIGMLFLAA